MWLNNQFNIRPGVHQHNGTGTPIVVTDIATHEWNGSEHVKAEDPLVIYRDLVPSAEEYVSYSMKMSEFKVKFREG